MLLEPSLGDSPMSALDTSFTPNHRAKGSYYRRIEDIDRALALFEVQKLPPAAQCLIYYFACEKLARAIVGIHERWTARTAYERQLRAPQLRAAGQALRLPVDPETIESLFGERPTSPKSARLLRHELIHDFGPTHARDLVERAPVYIPRMKAFLACSADVLSYLKRDAGK